MSDNYYGFEKFCKLLDDNNILKNATAIGVMVHLQKCIEEIKSNVFTDLLTLVENKKDHYLDLKINEIKRQDYIKDYGKDKIQRWLKEFNVDLNDILANRVDSKTFYNVADTYYEQNSHPETKEYNLSKAVQNDFLLFFLNYYANELILFLESKKTSRNMDDSIKANNIDIVNNDPIRTIIENICKLIIDSDSNKRLLDENINIYQIEGRNYPLTLEKDFYNDLIYTKWMVTEEIQRLQLASIQHNYFFYDCAFGVYVNYYEQRLLEFIKENIDASEADFIKYEIEHINNPTDKRVLMTNKETVFYNNFIESEEKLVFSKNKKISFLTKKLRTEGWEMKFSDDVFVELYDKTIPGEMFFEEIQEFEENKNNSKKIKWIGKPSQLGYIISNLAQLGYIEAPLRKNGEINYVQFAGLVKETIECETTVNTLSKYLNLDSDKGQETSRNFKSKNFYIPFRSEIS